MKENNFDAIVIGAGSVGLPSAMSISSAGLKVLVIDSMPSVGQGQNKTAIGGIRATHSHGSKIKTCLKSIEIFKNWQEAHGDDIGWTEGGYTFPAYSERGVTLLKDSLKVQHGFGLKIDWADTATMKNIVPGINTKGLLGGTFSPQDGNASPLLCSSAFFKKCSSLGVVFKFNESVKQIKIESGKVKGVITDKDTYWAPNIINAAGARSREIGQLAGVDIPVTPDSHEAGITEPVERFFKPMVVDMRPGRNSKNIYFYQNSRGHIIFCLTPDPIVAGTDTRSTSALLPLISERLISIIPILASVKVRRVWRGLYPMTPDGFPIVSKVDEVEGLVLAVGMCGQGFMLGPGAGELVQKIITNTLNNEDREVLEGFKLKRTFAGSEKFK
ncbi:NAD(P)/FAD-dependent oxidoreductase [Elusimicrobiota bacterium]